MSVPGSFNPFLCYSCHHFLHFCSLIAELGWQKSCKHLDWYHQKSVVFNPSSTTENPTSPFLCHQSLWAENFSTSQKITEFFPGSLQCSFTTNSFLLAHKISSFPFLKSIPTLSCGHPYWFPCFHSQAPKKDVVPFFLQLLFTFRQFLSGFEFPQKQTLDWGFNCK